MNENDELYMMDPVFLGTLISGEKIYKIGQKIHDCFKSNNSEKADNDSEENDVLELQHCDVSCYEKIKCLGQIFIDDEKSGPRHVYLIGMDETKLRKVLLDFSNCEHYSVFSGQIAIVEGKNTRGDTLAVESIYTSTMSMNSPAPTLSEQISIVISWGPYTSDEDLSYQPLTDLIKYCVEYEPDVIILTGALLNSNHQMRSKMAERYDSHLEKMLLELTNNISSNTQILIVASYEDANSTFVYPTHPYDKGEKHPSNVHLLPDPCVVNIEGLSIGMTSTDIIDHLIQNEISLNEGVDRAKRAVQYLYNQKSFYPLRPSNKLVPLDVGLAEKYAQIKKLPNIMITPSASKEYIRVRFFFFSLIHPNHYTS